MPNNLLKKSSLTVNDYWFVGVRFLKSGVHKLPRWLFIKHTHTIDVMAIVVVLLFAAILVITLLFITPEQGPVATIDQKDLSTVTIDRLELWLEERNNELNSDIQIRSNVFLNGSSPNVSSRN